MKIGFKHTLRGKTVIYGTILSMLAVLLTIASGYLVSHRLTKNQFDYVNKITTSAAVERTNMYMGEIAMTFNSAMNSDAFDILVSSRYTSDYNLFKAQNDYEAYLKRLIPLNDKIDALVLVNNNNDIFINIGNVVGKDFSEYKAPEFIKKVQGYAKVSGNTNQVYLNRYSRNNYDRISVINPVINSENMQVEAIVIAVLSKKLTEDLQFAGGTINLADGAGNYATVINQDNSEILEDNQYTFKNKLNFNGWTIYNSYKFDKIQNLLNLYFLSIIKYGLLYIFLSLILLLWLSKLLVKPISQMEREIGNLNEHVFENKPINLKKRKLGFKSTILILYTVIVTIPVVWFTTGAYINSNNIIENRLGSVFEYGAKILYQHIDFIFSNYYKKGAEIAVYNNKVQTYMDEMNNSETKNSLQYILNDFLLSNNFAGNKISNVSILDKSFNIMCSSIYNKSLTLNTIEKKDLEYLNNNYGTSLWKYYTDTSLNNSFVRIGMSIRGNGQDVEAGKLLGYMFMDFESSEIKQMLDNFSQYSNVWVYLTDENGQNTIGKDEIIPRTKDTIQLGIGLSQDKGKERVSFKSDGNSYIMIVKEFALNSFKLIYILENFDEGRQILYTSITILAILIFLSLIFSYGFSVMLSRNFTKLLKTILKIKAGDLSARFKRSTVDEIGVLGDSFNEMLDQLNRMIDEKYISEVRLKDAEIKAREYELNLLQAQINPHFLYNTLKTAQYMVYDGDPRAEKMIKLLIALFKTGITRGEKLVCVKDEIDHVKTYIDIQQMRFSNKFDVIYNISDDLMKFKILKLILQPLVENAIYHGLELKAGKGEIRVDAIKYDNMIVFKIKDNGLGINTNKLNDIKDQLNGKSQSKSIGLINVNERIKLHFGNEYGLDIESQEGEGTEVTATIPVLTD